MTPALDKAISKMSLEELVELRGELDKLISTQQADQKKLLLRKFKEMASESGLSLGDVIDGRSRRRFDTPPPEKKRTYKPKYQNPENPDDTWTGLGMKPRWVRAQLESGKDLTDLLIPEAA